MEGVFLVECAFSLFALIKAEHVLTRMEDAVSSFLFHAAASHCKKNLFQVSLLTTALYD